MAKKLLILLALLAFSTSLAQAEEGLLWAARVQAGVTGVKESIEIGKFKGFAQASLLRKVVGNKIYGAFSFKNINDAIGDSTGFVGENYALGTYIFAKDPLVAKKSGIPIAYIMLGVGAAHQPGYFAKISFDGGVGFFFPHPFGEKLGDWCIELSAFNAQTDAKEYWSGSLSIALQIPL